MAEQRDDFVPLEVEGETLDDDLRALRGFVGLAQVE
jgi:hypothetical protein